MEDCLSELICPTAPEPIRILLARACAVRGVRGARFLPLARCGGVLRVVSVVDIGVADGVMPDQARCAGDWELEALLPVDRPRLGGEGVLGGLVSDNGEVMGWLGLRAQETSSSKAAFRACAEGLRRLLRPPAEAKGGVFVLDQDGEPLTRCARHSVWRALPGFSAQLAALVQGMGETEAKTAYLAPGLLVELRRLHGADRAQVFAQVAVVERPAVPRLSRLTAAQLQIASFAALGATCPEIARSLQRSQETVRAHLKSAYARLEISSRAELARLFTAPWASP